MSEFERAIECFNNKVWSGELFESEVDMYNAVITVLRAELARQDAKPLACDGCKDQEDMYVGDTMCYDCRRFTTLPDRYEPKGDPNV